MGRHGKPAAFFVCAAAEAYCEGKARMSLDSQSDGTESYVTEGGVTITRRRRPIEYAGAAG